MKTNILMILDGVGINEKSEGNAFKQANTPNLDRYLKECAHARLQCSGRVVGLPEGQMGNSEVGHTVIGAGRVIYQDLTKIDLEIETEKFYKNEVLIEAINYAKKNNSKLHIMGLLSDGGVHSHINHLLALLELCKKENFKDVVIHAFMDGRDTLPTNGIKYIELLESKIEETKVGKLASMIGRYYAMDRDKRYDRTKKAYDLLTLAKGEKYIDAKTAILASYEKEINDEFIEASSFTDDVIKSNDSVIFFNFRPDRARQITEAIISKEYTGFEREVVLENIHFVSMTKYDEKLDTIIAYKKDDIKNTLSETISKHGFTQLKVAETEKYAHVTFFLN